MGNQSVGNFYKSDVRFLKEIVGRESEFEKPYLDEDYRKMHFDFPEPDWPPFPELPPMSPFPELPPFDGPVPGLTLCGITCYEPGGGDCTEPIWCHPSIWCGADMSCNLCSWTVEGATIGYSWKHIVDGVPSKTRGIEIWIDEDLLVEGKALIHAQMKDPCGNLCGKDLEVTCKVCPADIAMTWDSVNSDETIGQGNGGYATAGVYVADGLGPYTWSVAGTGFSMLHLETDVLYNTLQADATACGMAVVTVTDFCGTVKTGEVRCTAGEWDLAILACTACGDYEPENSCPGIGKDTCDPPEDLIVGRYRYRYGYPTGYEYWHTSEYCPPSWHTENCPGAALCAEQPPCGTPTACGSGTPTAGRTCYALRFWKDEWIC